MSLFHRMISILFTDECFEEFFIRLNFTNVSCIKQFISKSLGLGIIAGSVLVKVPQILKLAKARSSKGLSFTAVLLELICLTSAASYSFARGYPFSSWGESLFLLVETVVIGFMVLFYAGQPKNAIYFSSFYTVAAYLLFSGMMPFSLLWSLQVANLPIAVTAKLIQAHSNFRNGHTGQLSPITVFLLFLGSCARIFTSIQETGDSLIIMTFLAASLANGVLAAQVLYYWEATSKFLKSEEKKTQ